MHDSPISVLLVEDDASTAASLEQKINSLKRIEFKVEKAKDLAETIDALDRTPFDVILLDLILPDSQRLETVKRVNEKAPDVPIVVLTSLDDEALALKAVQAGAQDYLVKGPLDNKLLTQVILYAIERNRMRVELNWHAQQLKASEKRVRTVIEKVTDGLLIVDDSQIVRFVNPAAEALLKKDASTVVGKKFEFPTEPGKTTELQLDSDADEPTVVEVQVGEINWEGASASLASLRDVTRRKHAEETLKQANKDLKKLNRMKSEFISTVSHELRTPLTSMRNSIELLASGKAGEINEKQETLLGIAARNIVRLSTLVDELLDLSKIESGKLRLRYSDVDLATMINDVIATFQTQAERKSMTLVRQCPESMPPVHSDAGRVEQILCNLVSNAIKYTHEGGRIIVSTIQKDDHVEVSVADNGIGLSPEDRKLIFDRFYQVGEDLTAPTDGFGLGLHIVKRLVRELCGKISVDSEIGKGSRFFFTLPLEAGKTSDLLDIEREIGNHVTHGNYSLIVADLSTVTESTGDSDREKVLNIICKRLCRDSDFVIKDKDLSRAIILLVNTEKSGALAVKKGLAQAIEDEGQQRHVNLLGPVSYPEDSSTVKGLINFAYDGAGQ